MKEKNNIFLLVILMMVVEVVIVVGLLILIYKGYISKEMIIRVLIVLLIVLLILLFYIMIGYIIEEGIKIYLERRFEKVMYMYEEMDEKIIYRKIRERKEPYKGLVIKIIRLLIVIQTIMNPTYAIMIYVIYERLYLLIG
jgi:hypothetical protein